MVLDQPGHCLRITVTHSQSRTELAGNGGTGVGMILRSSLGNVMQEHRHIEHFAFGGLCHQFMGERVFFFQNALFDFRQDPHGTDQMLVCRVMMIHVELHQCDDAAEVGYKPPQYPRLVHFAQDGFRVLAR